LKQSFDPFAVNRLARPQDGGKRLELYVQANHTFINTEVMVVKKPAAKPNAPRSGCGFSSLAAFEHSANVQGHCPCVSATGRCPRHPGT
jgi:hypothetical protein